MANSDFYATYQHFMYIILHYCSLWMILTCIISSNISWRLFTILTAQNTSVDDANLAWWVTAVWSGAAVSFILVGLLFPY